MTHQDQDHAPDEGTRNPGRIVGVVIAVVLGGLSLYQWWDYVTVSARGYTTSGAEGQLMAVWFFLWAVPLAISVGAVGISFGWKHLTSKVTVTLGVLVLVAGLVTSAIGAQ